MDRWELVDNGHRVRLCHPVDEASYIDLMQHLSSWSGFTMTDMVHQSCQDIVDRWADAVDHRVDVNGLMRNGGEGVMDAVLRRRGRESGLLMLGEICLRLNEHEVTP